MPRPAVLAVPTLDPLDLAVRVRRIGGRAECMTTFCRNPARLAVEVTDRLHRRRRTFRACPECRSTALLEILEGR